MPQPVTATKQKAPEKTESKARPAAMAGSELAGPAGLPQFLQFSEQAVTRPRAEGESPDANAGPSNARDASSGGEGSLRKAPAIHQVAGDGLRNAHSPLPHFARIQRSFGRHDLSAVRTGIGSDAKSANEHLGSLAYTLGSNIAFKAPPDLRLAAHEAAHVVQQQRGVQLEGDVGQDGDPYERQADAAADRVVAGESAESVLDAAPSRGSGRFAVQAACDCGGTCASCRSASEENRPLQMKLEVNAAHLIEPDVTTGASPAERASAPDARATERGIGADEPAAEDSAPQGGSAIAQATGSAPPEPPVEPAEGGTTGGGEVSGGGPMEAASSGGGLNAECYSEPAEEPEEEPEDEPPEPEPTRADENIEPDLPHPDETDECPVEAAIEDRTDTGAEPVASAGEAGTAGTSSGSAMPPSTTSVATSASPAESPAPATAPGPATSPLADSIAQAEIGRAEAVAAFENSASVVSGLSPRVAALGTATHFSPSASEGPAEEGARHTAEARISDFFGHAAARLGDSVALAAQTVPDQLGATADGIKATIGIAIEQQKAAVSTRVGEARDLAYSDADAARSQVHAEHDAYVETVGIETTAAIEALTSAHLESLDSIDVVEGDALDAINLLYSESYDAHVALGPAYADRADARGEEYAAAYEQCLIFEADGSWRKDGFWAGYLTNRRARAQQNAARETARGYRDALVTAANNQGAMAMRGRRHDRCGIIAAARQARSSVDGLYESLVSALQSGREQAITEAQTARNGLLTTIDAGLISALAALDLAEHDDRQSLNDTGYLQQVAVEQAAHASAAAVQESVTQAVTAIERALQVVRTSVAQSHAPALQDIDTIIAQTVASVDAGIDGLLERVDLGVAAAQAQLAQSQDGALAALEADALASIDRVSTASDAFAAQMTSVASGAAATFGQMREQYAAHAQETAASGSENFLLAAAGLEQACDAMLTSIAATLGESQTRLEQDFAGKIAGLDSQETGIPKQANEAASHEQPAWKGVLAVVLIIAIIIVVALVIGPAVIGAVGAAAAALGASAGIAGVVGAVVGGAIVGAISSAAIQVVQNFATGRDLGEGVVHAMLIGAATGALGGLAGAGLNAGLNALIGQGGRFVLSQGAQFAVRAAANIASDAVLNVSQQMVLTGHVDWGEFAQGMAVSLFLHGSRRVQAFQSRVSAGAARATAGTIGRVTAPGAGATGRATAYADELGLQAARATEEARRPLSWSRGEAAPATPATETPPPVERESVPPRPVESEPPTSARAGETEPMPPRGAEAETAELAGAARVDEGESPPVRTAEPDAAPAQTGAGAPEEAMVGRSKEVSIGGEDHLISIRRLGRRLLLILCSNVCGEIIFKVRRMQARVAPGSPEWNALEGLAARARASDEIVNGVTPRSEAEAVAAAETELNALRDTMQAIQSEHPGLIDPDVPVVPEGGTAPLPPEAPATGTRVDLGAHMPDTATRVGDQTTIDLSSPNWEVPEGILNLGDGVEYLYVVRDNVSGEVLKVGSTADIETRAAVYARAGRDYSGRSLSMEVQPVKLNSAHPTIESVEGAVRSSVERGVTAERGGEAPLDRTHVLPWDATGGRLPTEPRGPGIPGVRSHEMREAGEYWWRERKWGADAGPAPARPIEPPRRPAGVPAEPELGRLLRQHGANLSAVARELGVNYATLRSYMQRNGLTVPGLMALTEP